MKETCVPAAGEPGPADVRALLRGPDGARGPGPCAAVAGGCGARHAHAVPHGHAGALPPAAAPGAWLCLDSWLVEPMCCIVSGPCRQAAAVLGSCIARCPSRIPGRMVILCACASGCATALPSPVCCFCAARLPAVQGLPCHVASLWLPEGGLCMGQVLVTPGVTLHVGQGEKGCAADGAAGLLLKQGSTRPFDMPVNMWCCRQR